MASESINKCAAELKVSPRLVKAAAALGLIEIAPPGTKSGPQTVDRDAVRDALVKLGVVTVCPTCGQALPAPQGEEGS